MPSFLSARQLASAALGLVVVATLWSLFAPTALGGPADYVVTAGTSMEPRFHTGDLAIVRSAREYRVGDIVAYRSRALNTIVLHRIIAKVGGR